MKHWRDGSQLNCFLVWFPVFNNIWQEQVSLTLSSSFFHTWDWLYFWHYECQGLVEAHFKCKLMWTTNEVLLHWFECQHCNTNCLCLSSQETTTALEHRVKSFMSTLLSASRKPCPGHQLIHECCCEVEGLSKRYTCSWGQTSRRSEDTEQLFRRVCENGVSDESG